MGSSSCKRYSLLGVAHPSWDNPSGTGSTPMDALRRGRDCEEGRYVALINLFVRVLGQTSSSICFCIKEL